MDESIPAPTVGTDVAAERAILGAMMESPAIIPELAAILRPEDFFNAQHGQMYSILVSRYNKGEPVDAVTMGGVFAGMSTPGHRSFLAQIGGAGYLHTLIQSVPIPSSAPYLANVVRQKAVRRKVAATAEEIERLAKDGEAEADELVPRAVHLINTVDTRSKSRGVSWRDGWDRALAYMSETANSAAISTGFPDLERIIGKPRAGQVIVIAGRPGSGKSVFAASIARNIAVRQGLGALYCTMEMSVEEMMLRNISAEAGVLYHHLRDNQVTDQEMDRIVLAGARLEDAPLYTLDTPRLSVVEFNAEIHRLSARTPIATAVFDYLQLGQVNPRLTSREQQIAELSRDFKLAAKELGIPIFVLAQLNRANESRPDKRPQLSDLRESGAVEQDADVVIMVHRPSYYDENDRPGEADLLIVKNRHGQTGSVPVASQLHYMRFRDLSYGR